jgi:(1->4)-alpha-D-glucan 1-alpha-D-glucosylmutase
MIEPRATYRVQLHSGFTFDAAADLTEYLAELGVSHLYCSPYLQATPGSTHGYDVVDHRRINEDLGGAAGHARMHTALRAHGLGQLLDIVPNHMAIVSPYNPWWWDVLENGPASNYASYFDVDWDTPEMRLRNSVLIPVLGDQYGEVLESGAIQVDRDGAALTVRYFDHRFPVAPRSFDNILSAAALRCGSDELAFLADSFGRLPLPTATDIESTRRRHREKDVLQSFLTRLIREQTEVGPAIDAVITEINRRPDALHVLLERQNFRLAYWRAASRDLGYRRFFDINTLVGLRMEDQQVFADTHFLILRWLADGTLNGVRVDHIDGLRDPEQYLQWLHQAQPNAWFLVEKILESGESLRDSWPIAGTTGYDFMTTVGGLLIDPAGERPLTRFYTEFTGEEADFPRIVLAKKDLVMREVLGSDLNRLTALFVEVCERHPRHRDYTRHELHEAICAAVGRWHVYRTYIREAGEAPIQVEDQRYIDAAIDAAKLDRPDIDQRLFDFLRDLLLLRHRGDLEAELAMRFQQFTGPVMAKSVEDTAFYCFNRFAALNEVGGDPARFGVEIDQFHRECAVAQARWPQRMLATSTHDSKRSEDLRARMVLLSEIPDEWIAAVRRWSEMNRPWWRGGLSDRNAEYLFYQTLVGAWPIARDRIIEYMRKAAREAKVRTSWTAPNEEYERSLMGFIEGALDNAEFVSDLTAFAAPLIWPARVNSLAQTLLKLTAPGVPDFYQGSELWRIALVDPDNRREVDYALRKRLLAELRDATVDQVIARADEGLPKLWLIRQALELRRRRPQLFGRDSDYRPLDARGFRLAHAIAFSRGGAAITIAPRLPIGLGISGAIANAPQTRGAFSGDWGNTVITLPPGRWHNVITGDTVAGGEALLTQLMDRFPVCLLARAELTDKDRDHKDLAALDHDNADLANKDLVP